ncbi:MAG: metallophosphoesterase [Clostridia bacterium]|nr:metallophosphoesterase [Clostridia bacterium]MBO7170226.1 metallophosphoesterase [Clostridia bacterium]
MLLACLLFLSLFLLCGCTTGGEPEDPVVGKMEDDFSIRLYATLAPDTYTLRYENGDGILAEYEEIDRLVVDGQSEVYGGFLPENRAPAAATHIGVYASDGTRVGQVPLAHGFYQDAGEVLYRFGALSDVHIGYETAAEDLARAITHFVNEENVAFIGIAGDLTGAATDEQLALYRETVDGYAGSTPVYAVTGNHDTVTFRGSSVLDVLEEYTGQPLYYSFTHGDDVFLMMGVYANQEGSLFTEEELAWLAECLATNKDKRVFLFQHVRPEDTSGNAHGIYNYDIWGGEEQTVFEELLAQNPNVIHFHGHSHLKLYLQEQVKNANYDGSDGYHSVHVPSVSVPRDGDETGADSREECYEESEGFLVEVYETGIRLRGYDFVAGKYLPIAEYFLFTN